jgi:hypothetical protein
MRKFMVLLFVLAGWSSLFACEGAMAQELVGQWIHIDNNLAGGARGSFTVAFYPNGTLQSQIAVAAGPGMSGSGITNCSGNYQFNGQLLQTQGSCVVCPAGGGCVPGPPMQLGGPVQFEDENTINIAGDVFRRQ